jgi:hypothetical protein
MEKRGSKGMGGEGRVGRGRKGKKVGEGRGRPHQKILDPPDSSQKISINC